MIYTLLISMRPMSDESVSLDVVQRSATFCPAARGLFGPNGTELTSDWQTNIGWQHRRWNNFCTV